MTKTETLEDIMRGLNQRYGANSIRRLTDSTVVEVDLLPTGVLPLDLALGGGLPRGRFVEVYGPPSSGKSTLAMHLIAETQRRGGVCAYIDAEHAIDPAYARALGVNLDDILLAQPMTAEEGLEIAKDLARSGEVAVIVVDSVAALIPRAEIEGDMGDSNVGLHARLMGQGLRKLVGVISQTNTLVIFINQLREKIGVMYGSPETTPGGRALPFYASVRLDVRKIESIKKSGDVVANRTRVKIVKSKVGIPFRQAEFDIVYGKGVPKENALIDCAVGFGVIKKAGAWYAYLGENIGQGKDNAAATLMENPKMYQEIDNEIRRLALNEKIEDFGLEAEDDAE